MKNQILTATRKNLSREKKKERKRERERKKKREKKKEKKGKKKRPVSYFFLQNCGLKRLGNFPVSNIVFKIKSKKS